MKIGIIGANDLSVSFGLLCEKKGHTVIVADSDENYIFNLNQKICLTNEPLVQSMLFDTNKFSGTTNHLDVIENSDLVYVFVPTPSNIDGSYDTTKVFEIVAEFYTASSLNIPLYEKKLIINSIVNPGEVDQIQKRLDMFNIQVAYNPFFTNEGEIVKDIDESDIVLIGCDHTELSNLLTQLHTEIKTVPVNTYIMSPKASEITKISINCFLAAKISYANMIGEIMSKSGIEGETNIVLNAIGGDTRIGKKLMKYGFGFGGPSIPKDNRALQNYSKSIGVKPDLLSNVEEFNKSHAEFIKDYYIQKNPNKEVPFVLNHITHKKGSNTLDESQQFQLCVDLLIEGYFVNVIEISEIANKLNSLSESYDGRLRFYKQGTKPEGILINL
jgi:UDPglucose 6-dehydrogenase